MRIVGTIDRCAQHMPFPLISNFHPDVTHLLPKTGRQPNRINFTLIGRKSHRRLREFVNLIRCRFHDWVLNDLFTGVSSCYGCISVTIH